MAGQDLRNTDENALSSSLGQFLSGKSGYKAAVEKDPSRQQQAQQKAQPQQQTTTAVAPVQSNATVIRGQSLESLACSKCQQKLLGTENYCPNCGIKVDIKLVCCNREFGKEDKFCSSCGKKLR